MKEIDFLDDDKKVDELLEKINNDIKAKLSDKRYNHSLGVMKKAEELAKIYGENVNKAKLIGLAHDIGKELPKEDKLKYAIDNGILVDDIEKVNIDLLHGKIGADICSKRYGFTNDMKNAIIYHTVGNENMDLLAKILFVADKIEDSRNYKDEEKKAKLEEARIIAKENIDKAVLYEIDMSLEYTLKKNELIHPDSIYTRNKIIMNLKQKK